MNTTFPVDWKQVFKSLSVFMTVAILVPVTLMIGVRYVSSGFNYEKTFEHVSMPVFLLILACVPLVSVVMAFLVGQWFRLATITLSEGMIHGRNFWGRKNKIPLSEITRLTPFSNNGIKAIVVHSKYHGQIYISDKTERMAELLEFLNDHLSKD
ncbi:hypothetical protein [Brevifollis gellanilyticus]|uniref:DUF304 domain-containing protein n=1 Tax=Brevifollis gellanilyticus TaxID=748831 RepID=A0A512M294_9BACT|nr:hypothetical protein [Brevifollis gellanilyticus]GEP40862.1 hypothetical protein BGE01nite_01530 [Brevifollis gellanilyticus]